MIKRSLSIILAAALLVGGVGVISPRQVSASDNSGKIAVIKTPDSRSGPELESEQFEVYLKGLDSFKKVSMSDPCLQRATSYEFDKDIKR